MFAVLPFADQCHCRSSFLLWLQAQPRASSGRPCMRACRVSSSATRSSPGRTACSRSSENVTLAVGPLLGGVLVAWTGPDPAYVLNAASFALSALLIVRIRRSLEEKPEPSEGHWRDLVAGLSLVSRSTRSSHRGGGVEPRDARLGRDRRCGGRSRQGRLRSRRRGLRAHALRNGSGARGRLLPRCEPPGGAGSRSRLRRLRSPSWPSASAARPRRRTCGSPRCSSSSAGSATVPRSSATRCSSSEACRIACEAGRSRSP